MRAVGLIGGLTAGTGGEVWFIDTSEAFRISTAGEISRFRLPDYVAGCSGLTVAGDGSAWLTAATRQLVHLGMGGNVIAYYQVAGSVNGPHGLVSTADQRLWFAEDPLDKGLPGHIAAFRP